MHQAKLDNNREYGLDLLRITSMLMIIILHVISHGGLGKAYASGTISGWLISMMEIAAYPAVDCFVLLSGYLLSNLPFKVSRITRVWLPAVFWSIVIQCIFFLINPEMVSPGTILYMFLPVLSGRYWFLNAYVVMILVSPVLNRLLRDMPRWQLSGLLLSLLAVFCVAPIFSLGNDIFKTQNGYAFPWFIVMYLCGGYIRRYCPMSANVWKIFLGYLLLVFGHLLWNRLTTAVIPGVGLSNLFTKYTSIPVFGSALCLLQLFRSIKLPANKYWFPIIKKASPLVFGIYLIHDHPLVRVSLLQDMFLLTDHPTYAGLVWMIGVVLGIFVLCICLEWIRSLLFKLLHVDTAVENLCKKMTEKIASLLKGEL